MSAVQKDFSTHAPPAPADPNKPATKGDLSAMEKRLTQLFEDTLTQIEKRFDGFEDRLIKAGDSLKETGEGLTRTGEALAGDRDQK